VRCELLHQICTNLKQERCQNLVRGFAIFCTILGCALLVEKVGEHAPFDLRQWQLDIPQRQGVSDSVA
jgi:hypothetical protein